jgi:peptide/nickel transport system substrate-binding protein
MLLAGEADVVYDVHPDQAARVVAAPCCRLVSRGSSTVEYLHLSRRDPRFADARVRRAIHLALDRQKLVQKMFHGHAEAATQIVVPGVFGFDPGLPQPERDLATARHLLAEAGYPAGFPVTLEARAGRRAGEIADQLGELGLHVTTVNHPWGEMFGRLRTFEVPFYYGGVAATAGDASDVLESFAHRRDEARGYGSSNWNGYESPRLDALIEHSGLETDLGARRRLLAEALRLMMQELYLIPLVSPHDLYGVRRDLVWTPRQDRKILGADMERLLR